MSTPETTSAEAFWRYAGGRCLYESRGEAWRDIKAWIYAHPPVVDTLHIPSVSEPSLAWTTSGEVDFQEREDGQSWVINRLKKGSFVSPLGRRPLRCPLEGGDPGAVRIHDCFHRSAT